ncbi:MAG: ThiF family adenylyltransferase [Candidatus Omnitrophica bacterium]|nr:ThiF family adenylyltransferase [Candidatus Omnitrophota bacterium]
MISNEKVIKITDTATDRYATFGFISWWDQEKIRNAKVMVAGAGALGNEVLKNLALMGIGHIFIVDFDTIEAANLTRSILFKEKDNGRKKAEVAASKKTVDFQLYSPTQFQVYSTTFS